MKQVLKLTEYDLIKVIKKLLKEESTPPDTQYYTYDGVEYKRNIDGQWFYWESEYKKWNDVYGGAGLRVNGNIVYPETTLEKMWAEKSPYLISSTPEKAEKTEFKQTLSQFAQSYQLPKSKETVPKKKLITPANVILGKATQEEYNINYETPAIGPDGCQVGYEVVSQEEIENSKNKVIKPWDDTRTGPSNYKKINGKICKKVYPDLPEITLSSVMEAIREFLNGTAGTIITTILDITGIGALATEIIRVILLIWDFVQKDWYNFIGSLISVLTAGKIGKFIGSKLKNLPMVNSLDEAFTKLSQQSWFKNSIGNVIETISENVIKIAGWLGEAASAIDNLFGTSWARNTIDFIVKFARKFTTSQTQGEIRSGARDVIYTTTNESIRSATRKVLLEYSRQRKYVVT